MEPLLTSVEGQTELRAIAVLLFIIWFGTTGGEIKSEVHNQEHPGAAGSSSVVPEPPKTQQGVPTGLLRRIAEAETKSAAARANYTYRQSLTIQEFNNAGATTGQYHEVRDITFSPNRVRYEQVVEQPRSTLTRIILTPEDFADLRDIQPYLLTSDDVSLYEGKYKGEETMDGERCFVEYVRPRQILSGQRFFEGNLWVRQSDLAVVRSEGQAVPQIETSRKQNLFPHFTTLRRPVDGQWMFPVETYADDTLFFRARPQRIRIIVRYMNYRHFGTESTVKFGEQPQPSPPPKR